MFSGRIFPKQLTLGLQVLWLLGGLQTSSGMAIAQDTQIGTELDLRSDLATGHDAKLECTLHPFSACCNDWLIGDSDMRQANHTGLRRDHAVLGHDGSLLWPKAAATLLLAIEKKRKGARSSKKAFTF